MSYILFSYMMNIIKISTIKKGILKLKKKIQVRDFIPKYMLLK